ncbi:hypothetical protein M3O75_03930 [Klebsiella pneumoniae]|nr:hypothetical protein [Klebsiella pneumoniae]
MTWRGQSAAWAEVIPKQQHAGQRTAAAERKKFTSSHPDLKGDKCVSFSTLCQQDASQSGGAMT